VSVNGQEAEYKQVEVGFKNNVQYIVIEMEGKKYSIIFPDADKNIAVLLQPTSEDNYLEGTMILAMNRKEKPNYDKYAKNYIREK
ncbi:glycosyltransferase, partial [Streptococcus gordonii]|nr:glycosyltransferase [Streptococcus gordonii]